MKPESNNAPFWRGDLVRCVDTTGLDEVRENGVYTVTEVFHDSDALWTIRLAEVEPAGVDENGDPWAGFHPACFRLLSRPTDLPAETHERKREPA